jgi:flagellar biosynthesis chaperone FliJ
MNKEEVATAAYDRASTALANTREKLEKAEGVLANWDSKTNNPVENKTLDEWKKEVAELKEKEKDAKQREEIASNAFVAVVSHSNLFSNGRPQVRRYYLAG